MLVASGIAVGAVLATAGGRPAGTAGPYLPVPATRPAAPGSAQPVLLGASADAGRAVPAVAAAGTRTSPSPHVAPLRGLRQAAIRVSRPIAAEVAGGLA